ncbi:MAG: hypothetical protein BGO04_03600 [Microbacterium sp. 70-38]|nr:MAG: hypothetical protein BGO04_03600 [Microbacterium sp. 70-38]
MQLLGQFNDELTQVFDSALDQRWTEIEQMLAISTLASDDSVTTRRLAEVTRLNRRAVSRMIGRFRSGGLVVTRASEIDGRVVDVVLTARGKRETTRLRAAATEFILGSSEIASVISKGMGPAADLTARPMPADVMDLVRRICEAGVSLVRFMPDAATRGQLAARQRAALVHIASHEGTRPNELSSSLGVSRAGVAYIVDQLCAKGFVSRHREAVSRDRRAVILEATADGVAAVGAVLEGIAHQREMLADLFAEVATWAPAPERRFVARPLLAGDSKVPEGPAFPQSHA